MRTPRNFYYKYPEILKEKLINFISENNRFPSMKETTEQLHINSRVVANYGGIDGLKKIIDYNDSNDLIDNRGDYNKSVGELLIANYLISQGLGHKYKREQYPFPKKEGYYRSDFTLYLYDNKLIHIEIWGHRKNEKTNRAIEYMKVRKNKELLYKKYNISLISIEYELFNKTYEEIQKNLYELFSPYLNLQFISVPYIKLLLPNMLTDDELYDEIMEISIDSKTLPSTRQLTKYNSGLYQQILKRGYTYLEFANKYNRQLRTFKHSWNKDLIFEYFNKIINDGKQINRKVLEGYASTLYNATQRFGYVTKLKLEYFNNLGFIPIQELEWVKDVSNNKPKTTIKYDNEDVKLANRLLLNN
jgi:hypothetical protein